MNDLVDDVGDVTGLPGRLVSARVVRDRGCPPLELETVAPVDGIVPANTNFSREESEMVGGWSRSQCKILSGSATIEIHIFCVVQLGSKKKE